MPHIDNSKHLQIYVFKISKLVYIPIPHQYLKPKYLFYSIFTSNQVETINNLFEENQITYKSIIFMMNNIFL